MHSLKTPLQFHPPCKELCTALPTAATGEQVRKARGQLALGKPLWSLKSIRVDLVPGRKKIVTDVSLKICILPLWATHDVIVVVADHITIKAEVIEQFGIVIGVVCDVSKMQHPRRTAVLLSIARKPVLILSQLGFQAIGSCRGR
jgi:hypothetical protein